MMQISSTPSLHWARTVSLKRSKLKEIEMSKRCLQAIVISKYSESPG